MSFKLLISHCVSSPESILLDKNSFVLTSSQSFPLYKFPYPSCYCVLFQLYMAFFLYILTLSPVDISGYFRVLVACSVILTLAFRLSFCFVACLGRHLDCLNVPSCHCMLIRFLGCHLSTGYFPYLSFHLLQLVYTTYLCTFWWLFH